MDEVIVEKLQTIIDLFREELAIVREMREENKARFAALEARDSRMEAAHQERLAEVRALEAKWQYRLTIEPEAKS